jgi:hypothetical protein
MSFLGFGARRRRSRKVSRKGRKVGKPSKALIKMCKKYGVMRFGSRTTGFGSKRTRTYKKASTLKKLCAKAIRRRIKQVKKQMKRSKKSSPRRRRRARFGGIRKTLRGLGRRAYKYKYTLGTAAAALGGGAMLARRPGMRVRMRRYARRAGLMKRASLKGGRREADAYRYAAKGVERRLAAKRANKTMKNFVHNFRLDKAGAGRKAFAESGQYLDFGKRRRRRVGRPRKTRRYRFGNGGNPPLSQSMGYEFCSNGGGVLGANSTGLFPTPCTTQGPAAAFGKRRRRGTRRGFGNMMKPMY